MRKEFETQMEYRKHLQAFIDRWRYNANRGGLTVMFSTKDINLSYHQLHKPKWKLRFSRRCFKVLAHSIICWQLYISCQIWSLQNRKKLNSSSILCSYYHTSPVIYSGRQISWDWQDITAPVTNVWRDIRILVGENNPQGRIFWCWLGFENCHGRRQRRWQINCVSA